jgi:hypothetical protein
VIAIGDLHGHYPALEALLDALAERHRIFVSGGSAEKLAPGVSLVLTGDYIDRGTSALDIIARLRRLARANPGRVITLFGNHELLALECFDQARNLAATSSFDALEKYESETIHGYNGGGAFVREFGHSTSRVAIQNYVERMARSGDVGEWIRSLLPWYETRIAGRVVTFTHADFSDDLLRPGVLARYKKGLLHLLAAGTVGLGGTAKKYGDPWLKTSAGFFWSRSFRKLDGARPEVVDEICDAADTDYIVTGHTPNLGGIRDYGGRIFDIDVGMTPAFGENPPQALLISTSGIATFSVEGEERQLAEFRPGEKRPRLIKAGKQCPVCGVLLASGARCSKHAYR